jgi:predicted CopG family antitoxin
LGAFAVHAGMIFSPRWIVAAPIIFANTYGVWMARKTITIDIDAYRRLKRVKQDGESFSQTIKRMIREPINFEQWMKSIEKNPLSDQVIEAVEAVVSSRRIRRNRGAA